MPLSQGLCTVLCPHLASSLTLFRILSKYCLPRGSAQLPCFSLSLCFPFSPFSPLYESPQAAITKHYRLNGLNNRCWFLIVLKGAESKIRVEAGSVSSEISFPGLQMVTILLCPHMVRRERELPLTSSYKDTNLVMMSPPLWPHYHLKSSPPSTIITLEIRAST